MSKKKPDWAGQKPAMKPTAHPAPTTTAVFSPGKVQLDEARKAFEAPWGRWCKAKHRSQKEASEMLDDLLTVFGAYAELTGTIPLAEIDGEYLGLALLRLGESNAPELLPFYIHAMLAYLEFAVDSELWEGVEAEFQALQESLKAMLESTGHQGPSITVPELSIGEELAAFKGSDLLRRLAELTEWVGSGKQVTAAGVLRPKDIEAAAAIMGVRVRGNYPGAATEPGMHLVRSMKDVPYLANAWTLLVESGILKVKSNQAFQSSIGKRWIGGTSEEQLAGCRMLTAVFLMAWLEGTSELPGPFNPLSSMLVAVFVGAANGELFAVDKFPMPGAGDELEGAPGAGLEDFESTKRTGSLALPLLRELAEYGLLEMGTHFRIPPAFIRCYAEAFAEDFDINIHYPQNEPLDFPQVWDAEEPRKPAISKVYQLKITLVGADPAIRRQILISSDVDFSVLHEAIQLVFGWDGGHAHGFYTGGRNKIEIGPPKSPYDSFGDAPDRYEDETLLEEFFTRRKTKINYVYGYGNNWNLQIILEDITDPVKGRQLPQCIAGVGAGPDEDCGGIWDWAELVSAVNDPKHPNHEERLEWMGMEPGELLDPNAFSLEDTDMALEGLRRM